jgi:HD-GYP domain-containing protein (c-di-GMP phosphodiesterase class II)
MADSRAGTPAAAGGAPEDGPGADGSHARILRTYETAALGAEAILRRTAETGTPNLRAAVCVMQPIVESIQRREHAIIGLTAIRRRDDGTDRHSLNVGLLAVAMGHALGLQRRELTDLGVIGLLHDVGKLSVPPETLRKPGRLSPEERRILQRHPLAGACMLARTPGLTRLMCDAMEVCLLYHLNHDGSGYPALSQVRPSAATRIIAVADCFDALAGNRTYHERPPTPYQSYQYCSGQAGLRFDPGAVWALGRAVGRYPPGSLLQTQSGYTVLAVSPNPDDIDRPCCRILRHPDGTPGRPEEPIRWSPMPPQERIVRVLLPEECGVEARDLLAA